MKLTGTMSASQKVVQAVLITGCDECDECIFTIYNWSELSKADILADQDKQSRC